MIFLRRNLVLIPIMAGAVFYLAVFAASIVQSAS